MVGRGKIKNIKKPPYGGIRGNKVQKILRWWVRPREDLLHSFVRKDATNSITLFIDYLTYIF